MYQRYGGGVRLTSDEALCWSCVRNRCASMRLRAQLDADSKSVAHLLKAKLEP